MDRLSAKITTINQEARKRSVCHVTLNDLALEYGKEYFVESKTISFGFFIRMIGNSDPIGPNRFNDIIYIHIYTHVFAEGMVIYQYGFYMTSGNRSITSLKRQWTSSTARLVWAELHGYKSAHLGASSERYFGQGRFGKKK